MAVGTPMGLKPGHTSSIRRIEGGMLSYHADATIDTNPFELGLDRLVAVDGDVEFIGKEALRRIRDEGVTRTQVGIVIDMDALTGPNKTFWPITATGDPVGEVTSAVWSPRLEQNIALAMVGIAHAEAGTPLTVETNLGPKAATVVDKPFYDPKKSLAAG